MIIFHQNYSSVSVFYVNFLVVAGFNVIDYTGFVGKLGKRPETVRQVINNAIIEAVWHQPSVLLLDDLDEIAAASSGPDQDMSPEAMYHGRIAEGCRI
jgi:hypothetical protein